MSGPVLKHILKKNAADKGKDDPPVDQTAGKPMNPWLKWGLIGTGVPAAILGANALWERIGRKDDEDEERYRY